MFRDKFNPKFFKALAGFGCIVLFLIFFIPSFFVVVDAGEVGVYSLFGKVSDDPLYPGFNFKIPFAKVIRMTTRTQDYTMTSVDEDSEYLTSTSGSNDAIESRASDGALIWLDITVLYHLDATKAPEIYKNLGIDYTEKLVRPTIRSSIRGVVANYTVTEIYSTKRDEIQSKLLEGMKEDLETRGIQVEEVLLRKVNLSQTLSASIEQKLAAQQEAEKYDFVLEKEEKEAERKRIEAEGQRDAQQIITQSLSNSYLYYLYIQNLKENQSTIYVPINPDNGMPLFKELQ
ncbi:prohibitin family protein [Candidatus Dojkabacteria bacterium]|nr:prohibitin family protein [Candidatus Dojkabacteria bacterium]